MTTTLPEFGDLHDELHRHWLSPAIEWMYWLAGANRRRALARLFLLLLFKIEAGPFRSYTARKLMARDHAVEIGAHSYGELFVPGAFAPSVKVGKYTSIAHSVRVFTQNHPIDELSTHPYFYEAGLGVIPHDTLEPATTEIGHDVWIGQGAIVLPGCKRIDNGAIVGAGAVVTKNVPAYAVVVGNPARVIKYRFDESQIQRLQEECWWDQPLAKYQQQSELMNNDPYSAKSKG